MSEKRLIDANALQRKLYDDYHGAISDSELKVYQVIRLLEEAPTVAAEPVRHAYWIQHNAGPLKSECSACRTTFNTRMEYGFTTKYCPHCGARMDLDATEKEDSK